VQEQAAYKIEDTVMLCKAKAGLLELVRVRPVERVLGEALAAPGAVLALVDVLVASKRVEIRDRRF
jgi:hypothetical protein